MAADSNDVEKVIDFWFGACGADGALDPAKRKMWFGSGNRHDAEIRDKFGELHARAARGELDAAWPATPPGRLALIVVLDQFSRHVHRGTPGAFAQDPAAQRLALDGIDAGVDRALIPAQRCFFYLPLEHAEDAKLQALSVQCFEALARDVAPAHRGEYDGFADYARRHRDVIARFGRFPHRNKILGRESTAEETEFLKQPGSAF